MSFRPAGHRSAASRWLQLAVTIIFSWATGVYAQAPEIVAPRKLVTPAIPYPEDARGDAEVTLVIKIEQDGRVTDATVRDGESPFAEAAVAGVRRWRFSPATRDGAPVAARILAVITFSEPLPVIPSLPSLSDAPARVNVRGVTRVEIGSTFFPVEDARLIPGAFADPFRVAEVLPAVAPVLSGLPYYTFRGAPPEDVGYFIDGVRVPLLFHVGAGPSIIQPSMIQRVEPFPSAYPAAHGRSAGGILAGETKPFSLSARGELAAKLFESGGMLETPFAGGRGNLLLGGRRSYAQPLLDLVAPDYELDYWDYQARLGMRAGANDSIYVFAFGSSDSLENRPLRAKLIDAEFHRIDLRWDNRTQDGNFRLAVTGGTDRISTTAEGSVSSRSRLERESLRLRLQFDQDVSSDVTLRGGADYGVERVGRDTSVRNSVVLVAPSRHDLAGGAHVDAVFRAPGVEVVPGARADVALWRDEGYAFIEPRVAARLRLFDGVWWASQIARTHQLPTDSVRRPGGAGNRFETAVQRAWQAAQGLELNFSTTLEGKLTGFYSWIATDDTEGQTRSYGVEAFLRRRFSTGLGFALSYTYSRTQLIAGREVTFDRFDRPHVVSAVLGYDIGAGFSLGLRGYYASGQRYQVACPTPDCAPGPSQSDSAYVAEGRLEDFYRADLRVEKRWAVGEDGWIALNFEWFNATLSGESNGMDWTPEGGLTPIRREPLTVPSIGIDAGF